MVCEGDGFFILIYFWNIRKNFKRIWTIGRLSEATDSIQNKS